jgi:hypothetical protein
MAISRRKFIKAGGIVALSAAVPLEAAAKVLDSSPRQRDLGNPTRHGLDAVSSLDMQAFSRQLQTSFLLSHPSAGVASVKLVKVHEWRPNTAPKNGRECFSLMFRGSESVGLRQNTYTVEHDALGKFEMLLVPIGNKQGYYEALFNRLH